MFANPDLSLQFNETKFPAREKNVYATFLECHGIMAIVTMFIIDLMHSMIRYAVFIFTAGEMIKEFDNSLRYGASIFVNHFIHISNLLGNQYKLRLM